jgi:hypothetical protein
VPDPTRFALRRFPIAETLVWAGAAACIAGILATRLWAQLPLERFAESIALAGLAALLAWPLRRWRGWSWATSLAMAWAVALVAMTGVLPMLAVLLLVAAAAAIGGLAVGNARPLLAWLSGMALVAALLGWLLPLPLHRWWTYGPLLLLAVVLRRRELRAQLATCIDGWRHAVQAAPRAAAWSVLLAGIASTAAWAPTLQYDDLAYHLGLPWQLLLHGRYALDPSQQVWALAPWAGDILQAVPQVLAHAEARAALNLAWLVASIAGLWQLGTLLGLRPALRWAAPALFASLPMTAALLGGMQTETAAVAVTVGLAVAILDARAGGIRRLLAAALLFGLLCALKPLHAIAALPLLAWAGWRARHTLASGRALAGALLLVLLAGGSSYLYAWLATGNPVLPLFNDVFHSPWFATTGFNDLRWQHGFGADLAWRLTFHTSDYLEGWDGAMGLVLVALSGAWLLALADRTTRGLAWCATLAIALPLLPLQYARYLHPGLVLLLPALVFAVQRWLPPRRGTVLLVLVCIGNLAFQANAHWLLHVGVPKRSLLALGRDAPLFERYAPERVLAAGIRQRAPDSGLVLLLSQPFQAEFAGRGRDIAWYAPRMQVAAEAADHDASGAAWAALLRRQHIAEVILDPATIHASQRAGLARIGAHREMAIGNVEWWRIPEQEVAR